MGKACRHAATLRSCAAARAKVIPFAAVLSCAASVFFFWIWYERYLSIDFNALGRHYDAEARIVYTDAAFVWCIPAFMFLLLAVGLVAARVWRRRTDSSTREP